MNPCRSFVSSMSNLKEDKAGLGLLFVFYPALTAVSPPPQCFRENREAKVGVTARKSPIIGTQTKPATSCSNVCVTHFLWAATNNQWGMEENPTD